MTLALDFGTNLGWATHCPVRGITAGTMILASKKNLAYAKKLRMDRRLDIRISVFAQWLEAQPVDLLVWEDLKFCSSQAWGHFWGSLRGVAWSYAARRNILTDCLDAGSLKKWATGSGHADKPAMESAVKRRWPELIQPGHTDDTYDAICLLQWAREIYKIK